jgi:3-methylfumaryl-CoA hydratase
LDARDFADRTMTEHDEVSLPLCRRLCALLDLDPAVVVAGAELPLAWSSVLFPSIARQGGIGPDGHARRGDFLPDVGLPRRRFAGRQVELSTPLRIGDALTRRSTIADVTEKTGRNGPMVFVTIRHEVSSAGKAAYVERQRVVYLGPETTGASPRADGGKPEPRAADWERTVTFDPVMLFRYSALTFNGHRIHYDREYAVREEGYAGLVVNGGLTTLSLLEMARDRLGGQITGYAMRARKVLLADRPVRLCGAATEAGAALWALDLDGDVAVEIDVTTV